MRLRAASVTALFVLVPIVATGAGAAPSRRDVQDAKDRLERIEAELADVRAELASTQDDLQRQGAEVEQNEVALERVQVELARTRAELDRQRAAYEAVTERLDQRAVEAYIQGPASGIDFVLGAESVAELTDRLAYADALAQSDAELATEVANVRNRLIVTQDRLESQRDERARALARSRDDEQAILETFQHVQELLDREQDLYVDARASFRHQRAALQRWLEEQRAEAPTSGGGTWTGGPVAEPYDHVFDVCPVDPPRAYSDGFGAPRYAGGYHLHKGVDLVAPTGTAIRAPFDGYANRSWNWLGGDVVFVVGQYGRVYNAHLSRYSDHSTGPVSAGDIIGYVGTSGDAQGGVPHDHFEFHPNTMPASWFDSSYGYETIEDAINPYPLLVQACG